MICQPLWLNVPGINHYTYPVHTCRRSIYMSEANSLTRAWYCRSTLQRVHSTLPEALWVRCKGHCSQCNHLQYFQNRNVRRNRATSQLQPTSVSQVEGARQRNMCDSSSSQQTCQSGLHRNWHMFDLSTKPSSVNFMHIHYFRWIPYLIEGCECSKQRYGH